MRLVRTDLDVMLTPTQPAGFRRLVVVFLRRVIFLRLERSLDGVNNLRSCVRLDLSVVGTKADEPLTLGDELINGDFNRIV